MEFVCLFVCFIYMELREAVVYFIAVPFSVELVTSCVYPARTSS
jgi:hypothetical protein